MAELPPDIAQFLATARLADEPCEADRTRLAQRIATTFALPASELLVASQSDIGADHALAASGVDKAASSGAIAKALAAVSVMIMAAAGAWHGLRPASPERSSTPAPVAGIAASAPQPAPILSPASPERSVSRRVPDVRRPSAHVAGIREMPTNQQVGAHRVAKPNPSEHAHTRSIEAVLAPRRALSAVDEHATAEATHDQSQTQAKMQSSDVHHSDARAGATEPAGSAQLRGELELIDAAARALDRGDGARALHALGDHRSRFGVGFLAEERSALEIMALCQLGRGEEAAVARARFDRNSPRSPLRGQIEAHCSAWERQGASRQQLR